jgi:hypothetical protein
VPPVLKAKMFGLPRWAWLAILAGGITVGLILRHKAQAAAKDSGDPCDPNSTAYDPNNCTGTTQQSTYASGTVPDSGDPCDPGSASYDPSICSGNGSYFDPGGGGAATGVPVSPGTTININPPTLPSPTDPDAVPTTGGCSEDPGAAPAGFHFECVSNRWTIVADPHAAAPVKKPGATGTGVKTGGGPPNKPNDKNVGISQHQIVPQSPPTAIAHPQAVDTGNPCVKGGVGGHTAPPGYHLFCGSNGRIWRAPNS